MSKRNEQRNNRNKFLNSLRGDDDQMSESLKPDAEPLMGNFLSFDTPTKSPVSKQTKILRQAKIQSLFRDKPDS